MKLSRFTVTLTLCVVVVKSVTAEPEAAILQNNKVRQPTVQTLNTVSSTIKPDNAYSHNVINQQQYIQQPVIQQPVIQQSVIQQPVIHQPLRLHQVPVHPQIPLRQQYVHPVPPPQNVALPSIHPQTQQQIIQFVQRALYTSQQHQQPTAMIIIAQPTLMPANLVYGNPSPQPQQQQFQYYPAQTQTRYQYIQPQAIPQPVPPPAPQPIPQQVVSPYQMVPVQLLQQYQQTVAAPVQVPTARAVPTQASETYSQQKALELDHISQIAQAAAQKYFSSNSYQPQPTSEQRQLPNEEPVNSLPPIITGLENFSPEQQVKIKEQLSAHFGAPLQPLHLSKDIQKQIQDVQQNDNYQSTERNVAGNTSPFVPSVELKSTKGSSESSYTKRPNQ